MKGETLLVSVSMPMKIIFSTCVMKAIILFLLMEGVLAKQTACGILKCQRVSQVRLEGNCPYFPRSPYSFAKEYIS